MAGNDVLSHPLLALNSTRRYWGNGNIQKVTDPRKSGLRISQQIFVMCLDAAAANSFSGPVTYL
jgi:hypothetical protein